MKRDFDLIRRILAHIEDMPAGDRTTRHDICEHFKNEYDCASVNEHLRLLIDEDLITEETHRERPGIAVMEWHFITGLTWKGHDFLDASRDESIWLKAKETILKPAASITFALLLIDADHAFVATDTLAVSTNGEPSFFATKAFIVPHLRMIIAGTGISGLLGKWFVQINDGMLVSDIDHLNYHTPENLKILWEYHLKQLSVPPNVSNTITVYHFGFSKREDVIHAYAYRSTNNFKSESLGCNAYLKPEANFADISEGNDFVDRIKPIMESQRAIQALKPKEERLYIGGEIQITYLTRKGFNAYSLCKFDDYESDEAAMYRNFDKK